MKILLNYDTVNFKVKRFFSTPKMEIIKVISVKYLSSIFH